MDTVKRWEDVETNQANVSTFDSSDEDEDRFENVALSSDEEEKTGVQRMRIQSFDPFKCDEEKRGKLIAHVSSMTNEEREMFMMAPLPPGVWLECQIERIRTGKTRFGRKFSFNIHGGCFLAMVVKRRHNKTANYIVSTDMMVSPDTERDDANVVGKIRSNFIGSQFMAFDTGLNPKNLHKQRAGPEATVDAREELAALRYEHGVFSKNGGPRRLHVILPSVRNKNGVVERVPCRPAVPEVEGLVALADHYSQTTVTSGEEPLVCTYTNKLAVWNESVKSYVLNFNDRVKVASVKNFQLVPTQDANEITMQFGRSESRNIFNLDFRYPMSPFQALSLAITSMDYKLCRE